VIVIEQLKLIFTHSYRIFSVRLMTKFSSVSLPNS